MAWHFSFGGGQVRVMAVLFALALAGCSRPAGKSSATAPDGPAGSANQTPVQGDWVIQRISADIDTLNPLTGQDTNGQMISSRMINEGMLVLDDYTLKLRPLLAESWEISPDQLTYTFHLRHGVRWHDGAPFTADDIKFTYDRIQDPKVDAAPARSYFTNIKSCEVLDPYTVRFTATERYFKTLEVLGTYILAVPKHLLEHSPDFNGDAYGRHPIGTGPYKFVRWDTGSRIILERNDDYWGGPIYYPKRLVFEIIEESYIATQLLKKGDIDAIDAVAPILWERDLKGTRSMERLHEIVYPYPAYTYVGFNLRQPMFSDIRVRHAIDLLMPRDEIIHQVYLDLYATKTSGYDPPSTSNYNHDVPPTPYDPAQALQFLHDAGWKNDHGDGILYKDGQPLSFTLLYPSGNSNSQKVAELIQESLRKEGVDLKLTRLEFAQLIAHVEDWKFDAVLSGWGLDMNGDPSQIWSSSEADVKKSSNFIGFKDPEVDKLIAAGRLEYDDEKRAAIYRQVQKLIHDDYPVCFLFNPQQIAVISNRYQDVKTFAPRPCFDIMKWWVPTGLQKYKD